MPALLVLLLACGLSEDRFAEEMSVAVCDLYEECGYTETFGFESVDQCQEVVFSSYDPAAGTCADHQPGPSADCLDGVAAMSCQDLYDAAWPAECSARCG